MTATLDRTTPTPLLLADGAPAEVAQALGGGTLEEAFIRATA